MRGAEAARSSRARPYRPHYARTRLTPEWGGDDLDRQADAGAQDPGPVTPLDHAAGGASAALETEACNTMLSFVRSLLTEPGPQQGGLR
ncbi:protein of unknown function [Candidatus Hydrogenisulfobacillus filiaventi]|uniref:Uncharacterized protein n=1 Tax=Candidatus Hydrogenisulfobacillus filiaventi TaxID=2707344 RepID=A0A6F8ZFJ2_9FIRM|nr:protein of unknown function [Candidatus Hydrogenisulfobacillus filiaventi]